MDNETKGKVLRLFIIFANIILMAIAIVFQFCNINSERQLMLYFIILFFSIILVCIDKCLHDQNIKKDIFWSIILLLLFVVNLIVYH